MPAQQRRWRDHESVPAAVREQASERSDERTIGGPKPGTLMLTSQNRELVPQQHQFHVFGELRSTVANEQPQNSSERTPEPTIEYAKRPSDITANPRSNVESEF